MFDDMNFERIFIDGNWVDCVDNNVEQSRIAVLDPSTGEQFAQIVRGQAADIDLAVAAARTAVDSGWASLQAVDRGRILHKIAELVLENSEELANIEMRDVGKPLSQAQSDVVALARYFEFYAGAVDKIHGQTIPFLNDYTVYTLREPHGVTGHIIPWNYPLQILGRSVGAALAVGNAAVLKPAEEASLSALAFAEIARQAGLPAGSLNVVTGFGEEAGAALAIHPGVDHLSFTGSLSVGQEIQRSAANNVVPVTLELGGKSPQLVFDDADIDCALPFLVSAGIQNAGQTCSASSRLLVHKHVYAEVEERLVESYRKLRTGSASEDLDLGPLISQQQKTVVEQMITDAKQRGNKIAAQGIIDDDANPQGFFVAPTLFTNVDSKDSLAQDEIFGPVQLIIPFESEEHAIEIANSTDYGLVAGVWTRDGARQMRLAKAIHAGQVFINNYGAAGGVELPFGGVGKSGHGREKGFEALYGFSTLKTVAAYHA